MKSPDQEFAEKLKRHLDRSVEELRPGLAYRLQSARAQALARLSEGSETAQVGGLVGAHGFAWPGSETGPLPPHHRPLLAQVRFWAGILAIAAVAFGYYQHRSFVAEAEEKADLDAEILTSDLPIDAYLDRGFQNWLLSPSDDD
jgi:hypothetical protein